MSNSPVNLDNDKSDISPRTSYLTRGGVDNSPQAVMADDSRSSKAADLDGDKPTGEWQLSEEIYGEINFELDIVSEDSLELYEAPIDDANQECNDASGRPDMDTAGLWISGGPTARTVIKPMVSRSTLAAPSYKRSASFLISGKYIMLIFIIMLLIFAGFLFHKKIEAQLLSEESVHKLHSALQQSKQTVVDWHKEIKEIANKVKTTVLEENYKNTQNSKESDN